MNTNLEDRRSSVRVPVEMNVVVRTEDHGPPQKARLVNISRHGAKLVLLRKLERDQKVILEPGAAHETPGSPAAARVCWLKPKTHGVEAGIRFSKQVDWHVPVNNISQNNLAILMANSAALQQLLESIQEGILIIDEKMRVIALNSRQPFCLPIPLEKIIGRRIDEVCDLLELRYGNGTVGNIIQQVLGDRRPYTIPSLRLPDKSGENTGNVSYRIIFKPLTMCGAELVAIHCVGIEGNPGYQNLSADDRETFWLQCRYAILGRIFTDLLEDIVNPLSAAIGRSDLIALKIKGLSQFISDKDYMELIRELDQVQKALGDIREFCRAATRRRHQSGEEQSGERFSLNALIEDELSTLELHSIYKKLDKQLSLADDLPPVSGSYADWVYAFVALMQVIVHNMGSIHDKCVRIWTQRHDDKISWGIEHNGKALPAPIEKVPGLVILELLKDKYGVAVSTKGSTGRQQIVIEIPLLASFSNRADALTS